MNKETTPQEDSAGDVIVVDTSQAAPDSSPPAEEATGGGPVGNAPPHIPPWEGREDRPSPDSRDSAPEAESGASAPVPSSDDPAPVGGEQAKPAESAPAPATAPDPQVMLLQQQVALMQQQLMQQQQSPAAQPAREARSEDPAPDAGDVDKYPKGTGDPRYFEDYLAWQVNAKVREAHDTALNQARREFSDREAETARNNGILALTQSGTKMHPDFQQRMLQVQHLGENLSSDLMSMLAGDPDRGAHILYELAGNPAELMGLNNMSPARQAFWAGQRMSAAPAQPRGTKAPLSPALTDVPKAQASGSTNLPPAPAAASSREVMDTGPGWHGVTAEEIRFSH